MTIAAQISAGLRDAELKVPGQIVADITCDDGPQPASDGSTTLRIEALTVEE
ncbi:hypothetical protein ACUXST_001127 [Sphingomonas sp. F9_3S_D5_B_2]